MDILFEEGDSDPETYEAVDQIREMFGEKGHLSGPAIQNKTVEESLGEEMPVLRRQPRVACDIGQSLLGGGLKPPPLFPQLRHGEIFSYSQYPGHRLPGAHISGGRRPDP